MKRLILGLLIILGASVAPLSAQSLPNGFPTVQAVYATGQYDITTHDGQAAFTDAVICALHQVDSRWGNLRKNPGQTQIHGHAEDSALFVRIGAGASQSVDFIGSAGTSSARPAWTVDDPRYSESDWLPPHNCNGTVPTQPPTPGTPTPAPAPVVDLSGITGQLNRLERQVSELSLQIAAVGSEVRTVADRVEVVIQSNDRIARLLLEPVIYRGSVLGFPVTLRPTIVAVTP